MCASFFGEPEHLSNNQLKVIKGKHHDKCSDNTAKLEYFSYGERLVPNSKLYCINLNDFSLETFKNTFEKIREVWISNDFLKFMYQISIEFWIRNTLLQKFFQADMIFFDQFKVPTIKFGKCFAE